MASVMRNSNYPKPLASWKRALRKERQSSMTMRLTVRDSSLDNSSRMVWALNEEKSI